VQVVFVAGTVRHMVEVHDDCFLVVLWCWLVDVFWLEVRLLWRVDGCLHGHPPWV